MFQPYFPSRYAPHASSLISMSVSRAARPVYSKDNITNNHRNTLSVLLGCPKKNSYSTELITCPVNQLMDALHGLFQISNTSIHATNLFSKYIVEFAKEVDKLSIHTCVEGRETENNESIQKYRIFWLEWRSIKNSVKLDSSKRNFI